MSILNKDVKHVIVTTIKGREIPGTLKEYNISSAVEKIGNPNAVVTISTEYGSTSVWGSQIESIEVRN